jgi:hypothetical protein
MPVLYMFATQIMKDKILSQTTESRCNLSQFLFEQRQVFLPAITDSIDRHYQAINLMRKAKTTRNPNFPRGTSRRWQLYSEYPSSGRILSKPELDASVDINLGYWQRQRPASFLPRPWQIDPISSRRRRRARDDYIQSQNCTSLVDLYVAYREATTQLRDDGN